MMGDRLRTIRDHIAHYEDVDELMGFQYWLHGRLAPFHTGPRERAAKHVPEMLIHGMFGSNVMRLYHALVALEGNWVYQCEANMRGVMESVPKMYYCRLHRNEAIYVRASDVVRYIKDEHAKREVLKKWIADSKLDAIKKMSVDHIIGRIGKTGRKYDFKWMAKCLYTDSDRNAMRITWHKLSGSAHPSTQNEYGPYDAERAEECLVRMKGMLLSNVAAEIEGHREAAGAADLPLEKCAEFVCGMGRRLGLQDGRHLLRPSAPSEAGKVEF